MLEEWDDIDNAFLRYGELVEEYESRPEVCVELMAGMELSRFLRSFPWYVPEETLSP